MDNPCILYFRCWPGFDPEGDFPFEEFNGLPEEDLPAVLEAGARRCLNSKEGKAAIRRQRAELKKSLRQAHATILVPPGGLRHRQRTTFRPWFDQIDSLSGPALTRSVFRLFGWVSQPLEESWIATRRQYVARVDGLKQTKKAVHDLQREFWGETLSDVGLPLVPVFGHALERELPRVDLARLLDTEGLRFQETGRDLEEFCRWVVLRDVLGSKLMAMIQGDAQAAGHASTLASPSGPQVIPVTDRPKDGAPPPIESADTGATRAKPRSQVLSQEAKALAALADHPDWTDHQIAQAAGCHVKSLYRMKKFVSAKAVLKLRRSDLPTGRKDRESHNLDAWEE